MRGGGGRCARGRVHVALALTALLLACASEPVVVRRDAPHMGTTVTITVVAAGEAMAGQAIDAAFAEVARLDGLLSSYRPDSDLSRLNREAGAGPVVVSPELVELAGRAAEIARATGGAFNPLVGPAVRLWGIPDRPRVPDGPELDEIRPLTDLGALAIDPDRGSVGLARPGMLLDVGGIGKGYAADRVVDLLRTRGMQGGVVEMSGDVRAFGSGPSGRPWRVAVRDPHGGPKPLEVVTLRDGAISTSGTYERFFEIDGVRYHHILDPRTLRPAEGLTSVTVLAPEATRADALATAVLVLGRERGLALVARTPGVEAMLLDTAGGVSMSPGWPSRDR